MAQAELDTIDHLSEGSSFSEVSSIGAGWPPASGTHDRVKGIYHAKVDQGPQFRELMNTLNELTRNKEKFGQEYTRVSLRAVISEAILHVQRPRLDRFMEAIIPLHGTQPIYEDSSLVYLGLNYSGSNDPGANIPDRRATREELEEARSALQNAHETQSVLPAREILQRTHDNGYRIEILSKAMDPLERESVIEQMFSLYQRFGWNREQVETLISAPENLVAVAYKGNVIVSAGLAEMALMKIGSNPLRIAELTEAATDSQHASRGLYTSVSTKLLLELATMSSERRFLGGEIDLAYGECNANAIGVLKAGVAQGREFSMNVGPDYGFANSGLLPQHVPISGAPRTRQYNNLLPAYMRRAKIYEFANTA